VTIERQVAAWVIAFLVVVLVLWFLGNILLPFVAGMALAYFLDPVADRLERLGLGRVAATVVILLVAVVALIVVALIAVPLLIEQFSAFAKNVPGYVARIQSLLTGQTAQWLRHLLGSEMPDAKASLGSIATEALGWLSGLFKGLWAGGAALVSLAGLLVVTPVVAFYMLVDWDRMVASVDRWVPPRHRATVRLLAREMNAAVAGFVRGQALVGLCLGAYYAVGLLIVGLNFGVLIGFVAGILTFIPYVGSMTGLLLATGVAIAQFAPHWGMVAIVVAIFLVGQFVEGNILSPRLVGRSVGLHPVWLMFALFAFGSLFGFVGLLVAVPLAAAIGVLVRFALSRYLASGLYGGAPPPAAEPPA
jgi:predicted PurR-regulated permease PerM